MKIKIVLCLILAMAFMFTLEAGPAWAGRLERLLAGTWDLTVDWDCNGVDSTAVWTLKSDGTFTSSSGGSGTWSQSRRTVEIVYATGCKPKYTGTLQSLRSMSGEMICADNSGRGCFSAVKTSNASLYFYDEEHGGDDTP